MEEWEKLKNEAWDIWVKLQVLSLTRSNIHNLMCCFWGAFHKKTSDGPPTPDIEDLKYKDDVLADLFFLAPFIFFPDLFFLCRSEIILDIERFAYFFRGLSFNHVGDRFAGDV